MAYINHPTRYLIVKDPAAVAAGRFWAALVSLGKLRPAAHLVKLFFQLSFGAPVRFDRAADSATEGRIYARPSGPSTLFFNSVRIASVGRARFPARGVGLSTRPLAARQHFFSILRRGASALRSVSGFPKSGGVFLRPSLRPVNTFFQVRFAFAIRSCPAFRARAGLSTQPPPERQHLFSTCHPAAAKASLPCSEKWRYTPGPMGCQRGRLHYFHTATFYHGFPLIQGGCAALAAAPVLPPPHVTLAWTLHDCRARRQGLPRLPRPGWPRRRLHTASAPDENGIAPLWRGPAALGVGKSCRHGQ